jgi:hypothetical protein
MPQGNHFEPQFTVYILTYFMDKLQSYFDFYIARQKQNYENLVKKGRHYDGDFYHFTERVSMTRQREL